jgi:Arc/MetJ-type ribon-helix-helix transcriptional regulator
MTIHLPEPLETSILAAVNSGRFASLDAAMAEAATLLVERLQQEHSQATPPAAGESTAAPPYTPIWEVAAEIRKSVPAEEWAKLPADGAEQLDHYLYGAPKRPSP